MPGTRDHALNSIVCAISPFVFKYQNISPPTSCRLTTWVVHIDHVFLFLARNSCCYMLHLVSSIYQLLSTLLPAACSCGSTKCNQASFWCTRLKEPY